MRVFKLYVKLLKNGMWVPIAMYLTIFLLISFIFSRQAMTTTSAFETYKTTLCIYNNDESGEISQALIQYLSENSNIKPVPDNQNKLRDKLFSGEIQYVLTIPEDFSKSFFTDNPKLLISEERPNSMTAMFMGQIIENYLNLARIKTNSLGYFDKDEVLKVINTKAEVDKHTKKGSEKVESVKYFVNYSGYIIMGILMLCIPMMSNIFKDKKLKMRVNGSPIHSSEVNTGIWMGHSSIAMFILFALVVMHWFLSGFNFALQYRLYFINTLVFTLMVVGLCVFVSTFADERNISGISNAFSLGFAFLGGIFVPISVLPDFIKKIGIINPAYWFTTGNESIVMLSENNHDIGKIYFSFAVILLFAFVFFMLGLFLQRKKDVKQANK